MKHIYRAIFLMSALLVMSAGRASADTLLTYTFTGATSATFELPVNPTVTNGMLGVAFEVTPINLMINGVASNDFLVFYNAAFGGAFGAFSSGSSFDLSLAGPQLYSGPETSPTMLTIATGMPLTNFMGGTPAGTITTGTPTGTPEPSGLALLAAGLLALSAAFFVSKRSNAFSAAA